MHFFRAQTVFVLAVFYVFYLNFIEMYAISSQTVNKTISNREYIVKLSFSRFSSAEIPANDDEIKLDASISLICGDIEFECTTDHQCIALESYCDGKHDCPDESDEMACATTPEIHFSIINDTAASMASSTKKNIALIMFIVMIVF